MQRLQETRHDDARTFPFLREDLVTAPFERPLPETIDTVPFPLYSSPYELVEISTTAAIAPPELVHVHEDADDTVVDLVRIPARSRLLLPLLAALAISLVVAYVAFRQYA